MYDLVEIETGAILASQNNPVSCWQVREGIAQWVERPTPEKTLNEKIKDLNDLYDPQREALLKYITIAIALDDSATLGELRMEYTDLIVEYNEKLEVIKNG